MAAPSDGVSAAEDETFNCCWNRNCIVAIIVSISVSFVVLLVSGGGGIVGVVILGFFCGGGGGGGC